MFKMELHSHGEDSGRIWQAGTACLGKSLSPILRSIEPTYLELWKRHEGESDVWRTQQKAS